MSDHSSASPTVAVVDDDAALCRALSRLLTSSGYTVRTYVDARDFLSDHTALDAHCLILDLRIADVDGFDVFEETMAGGRPLPTVFITGKGDIASGVRAIKAGAVDFIEKPLDADVLLDAVERALALRRDSRQEAELAGAACERFQQLTPREAAVCMLVTAGWLNKQIADVLGIAEKTVKVHRGRVMQKMRASSVPELTMLIDWMLRRIQRRAPARPRLADYIAPPSSADHATGLGDLPDHSAGLGQLADHSAELGQLADHSTELGQLAESIGHELRTPLQAMGGYLELLHSRLDEVSSPQQRECIEGLSASQALLARTIRDLLATPHGSADVAAPPEAIPIDEAMADAQLVMAPLFRQRQIGLTVIRSLGDIHALANRGRLHQILINLLANALKFNPPGGVVRVTCDAGASIVRLRVVDEGPGIGPQDRERIFAPHVRLLPNPADESSHGLGLAISRAYARAMQGDLTVTDAPTGGAMFTLVLPRSPRAVSAPRVAEREARHQE